MTGLPAWRPSNGTEMELFFCFRCDRCERDRAWRDDEVPPGCEILATFFAEGTQPGEWVLGDGDIPHCTAFMPEVSAKKGANDPPPRCDHTIDMFDTGGMLDANDAES